MQSKSEWVGQTVDFDVRDAYLPTPTEILMQRYGNQILQGQVMDLTPQSPQGEFAVLRVGGVRDFVIVPCSSLRRPLLRRDA